MDQKVLLVGKDRLLGFVMGELAGAQVGGDPALGEQHGSLSGSMSIDSRSVNKDIDINTKSF